MRLLPNPKHTCYLCVITHCLYPTVTLTHTTSKLFFWATDAAQVTIIASVMMLNVVKVFQSLAAERFLFEVGAHIIFSYQIYLIIMYNFLSITYFNFWGLLDTKLGWASPPPPPSAAHAASYQLKPQMCDWSLDGVSACIRTFLRTQHSNPENV